VGKEILLDAQENPDMHASILVRVCGYSSYYIDLNKGMQYQIVYRTS